MLKLKDIRKFYGSYCAIDGLSMELKTGALYGLIGPNGAGKTTTIRLIAGITEPDAGEILMDGDGLPPAAHRNRIIGYVPDEIGSCPGFRVMEYMQFYASCYRIEGLEASMRIEKLLKAAGLEERADFYVDSLSRGMKQKLSLARALIHDPQLLIMDEPTSGLDPGTRYEFRKQIEELSEQGRTILISSHILSDISELCTDVGIISQGRMVMEGPLEQVMQMVSDENLILISLNGDARPALKMLQGDKRVASAAVRGNEIMINFRGSRDSEAALLKKLVEGGFAVRGFARQKGSLESIFLQLTENGKERMLDHYEPGGDF